MAPLPRQACVVYGVHPTGRACRSSGGVASWAGPRTRDYSAPGGPARVVVGVHLRADREPRVRDRAPVRRPLAGVGTAAARVGRAEGGAKPLSLLGRQLARRAPRAVLAHANGDDCQSAD
jgi:hypothetical protein